MKLDATIFIARLHEAEQRLQGAARVLTETITCANGNTGLKVQPEAAQMLKSADDLHALAQEIEQLVEGANAGLA